MTKATPRFHEAVSFITKIVPESSLFASPDAILLCDDVSRVEKHFINDGTAGMITYRREEYFMRDTSSINNSALMGRFICDPKLEYVNGDIPVCTFELAVTGRTSRTGEKISCIPCVAWRENAQFVSQQFSKGTLAIVTGQLTSRIWQDTQKNCHLTFEIQCDRTQLGETKCQRMCLGTAERFTKGPIGGLQITAIDVVSGEVLSGAAYDLYCSNGDMAARNIPSGGDCAAHIVSLPVGDYSITEVTVPQGYDPIASAVAVTIDAGIDASILFPHRPVLSVPQQDIEIPEGVLPEGLVDDDTDCPF